MRDHWIRKYLPTRDSIRGQRTLKPVRHLLLKPELWHLHRRSVGGAFFIGLFCAFMPVPSQMLLAALLAVVARCNLPIAVALVWITNPLTIGPMFFFAYKLGAWLIDAQVSTGPWELSWQWFGAKFKTIWWPLMVGCFVCGWVSGLTGAVASRLLWRLHVLRRWQNRRARRSGRRRVGGISAVNTPSSTGTLHKDQMVHEDHQDAASTPAGCARPSAVPPPDSPPSP